MMTPFSSSQEVEGERKGGPFRSRRRVERTPLGPFVMMDDPLDHHHRYFLTESPMDSRAIYTVVIVILLRK